VPDSSKHDSETSCLIKCGEVFRSRDIVSDYGLDDRAIGVRFPVGAKDCSSNLCVQTGSEAHPASCTMGTRGHFPGAKRGRGVTLTTHPNLVPRSGMSRSYTSFENINFSRRTHSNFYTLRPECFRKYLYAAS
jgi:hypothetical protein